MKKITVWLLALCLAVQLVLPLGASAAASGGQNYTIGSLVTVAKYITGQISLTPEQLAYYDVDGNGRVNITDLTRIALIIVGAAIPDPPGPSLSDQQAVELALSQVPGAQQSDIREFRREMEQGQLVYEVDLVYGGLDYEFEIRAADGTFLKWSFEQIQVESTGTGDIGLAEATRIALSRVPGATEADITELRKATEDGVPVYEGTILYGGRRYEFDIHAATGEFVQWGYEVTTLSPAPTATALPSAAPTGSATAAPTATATASLEPTAVPVPMPTYSPAQVLTLQQAQEIALSYVPGATAANIVECEQGHENGRLVYEGEIWLNGVQYEFTLDAYTGERLKWHMESRPQAGTPGVDIGAAQARALAVEQVPGAVDADITKCERDTEDGIPVYEIELQYGGFRYEFEIVASTGVICKSGFEVIQMQPQPTASLVPRPTVQPTSSATATPTPAGYISADRAREIALSQVPGATASDITKMEMDWENGVRVYEVEIHYGGVGHELEIDAQTGVVLSHHTEQETVRPSQTPAVPDIGREAAQQLVLSRVPGATAADFTEFKRDRDSGRLVYEGELVYNGAEYEFKIDAATGAFLEWEVDRQHAAPTGLISRERAVQIALGRVPGAAQSNVRKCQLDTKHGVPVYEIEIRMGRTEYELEIDARTGDVLSFEQDD